jgi:hypothetical protein
MVDPTTGRERKSSSPWAWLGCGCGAVVLLGMLGIAGLTWVAYQSAKDMEESSKDPVARAAKIREVLPYRELPAGYYAVGTFSLPFLMDVAILSDRNPETGKGPSSSATQDFDKRGFIYMNMRQFRDNKEKMRDFLEGKAPAPEDSGWAKSNVKFEATEVIRRGTVDVNGRKLLYAASRGEIEREGRSEDGLVTMLMPDCPNDGRLRFGLWFGPDPDPAKPVTEVDWAGTAADPQALAEFAKHFQFCG